MFSPNPTDSHHLLAPGSGPCLRHQYWQTHWDRHSKGGEMMNGCQTISASKKGMQPCVQPTWGWGSEQGARSPHIRPSPASSSGRQSRVPSQHRASKSGHPSPASVTVPQAAVTQRPRRCMHSGGPAPIMASPGRAALLTATTSASETLDRWPGMAVAMAVGPS